MVFKTRSTHSSLRSLISGLILGMVIHCNYDTIKPQDRSYVNVPDEINSNPLQFNVRTLNLKELDKLREIQELDRINDAMDPDPDDHIWRCITETKHKVRNFNEHDVHVKVKALWVDGEETWVRLDVLRLQDPCRPLIEYAIKRRLTKQPLWKWAMDYLKDDERVASMVHAMKAKVNGVQYMFGVEIPKNVKHALEMEGVN
jgi:hypothetical protein